MSLCAKKVVPLHATKGDMCTATAKNEYKLKSPSLQLNEPLWEQ